MKQNIFELPVFPGLVHPNLPSESVIKIKVDSEIYVAFRNDLSLVAFDTKEIDTLTECFTTVQDFEFCKCVLGVMLTALGIPAKKVPESSIRLMMEYVVYTSPLSCLKNMKANLSKEVVTVNGVGFFVN